MIFRLTAMPPLNSDKPLHADEIVFCLNDAGFAMSRPLITQSALTELEQMLQHVPAEDWRRRRCKKGREGVAYALRDVHFKAPSLLPLLRFHGVWEQAERITGPGSQLLSATLFNKVAAANWTVPAHQDLVIPVARRVELAGFEGWTLRGNVLYVQPPEAILADLIAARLHLDACSATNGALEIAPGSHRQRLSGDGVRAIPASRFVPCPAVAGQILLMRPLAVHRSQSSTDPGHRRVLHLLFAPADFPAELCRARVSEH